MEQNSEITRDDCLKEEAVNLDEANTVVMDNSFKPSPDDPAYDGMITIDENGMRWCTVKYAAEFLGKSSTTIRRYAQEKRLRHKQEQSPNNYGYVYLISVDDLELLKKLMDSNEKKSSVSHSDTAFELLSTLNRLDLPAIGDLREKMEYLQDGQIAVGDILTKISAQNDEFKSTQDTIGESLSSISKQNDEIIKHITSENKGLEEKIQTLTSEKQKLYDRIKELEIIVDRQKAVINELQSRGFFARIANKPPVSYSDSLPNNGGTFDELNGNNH